MFAAELDGIKALPKSFLHEIVSGSQAEYQDDHVDFSINIIDASLQDHPFGLAHRQSLQSCKSHMHCMADILDI